MLGRARPEHWQEATAQPGRTFVVTGANSGVGLATTQALVAGGAHVVLGVRDPAKGEAAVADAHGPGTTDVRRLDLSDLSSVREFAAGLERDDVGVDVLVNNAGVLGLPFSTTVDGVETQFATNHLGHFALANLLLPRIRDRVVVVGSASHHHGEIDVDDLLWERRGYRPYAAYAASKLAGMLFLAELQRRLTAAGSTLRATGAHPGTTASSITSKAGGVLTFLGSFGHQLVGMPIEQGALPVLYAATMDVPGNTYVGPHLMREMIGYPVPVGRAPAAGDPDLAKRLWAVSEQLSGVSFPL